MYCKWLDVVVHGYLGSIVWGGKNDPFVRRVFALLLFCFAVLRCPSVFDVEVLACVVLVVVSFMYPGVSLDNIITNPIFDKFGLSGAYLCFYPVVYFSEFVSYLFRPVVLILRPIINLSVGHFLFYYACFSLVYGGGSWLFLGLIFLLFLYEIFIMCVHWFIITEILHFTAGRYLS